MKETKLKILFICGSLEQGRDGVGDYTRRLAQNLQNHNVSSFIIAINDRYIKNEITDDNAHIKTLRIPLEHSIKQKKDSCNQFILEFKPDVISLQFVPYAFQKKGLPFWLINYLPKIENIKWQIMFHELWLGMAKNDNIKSKFIGKIQLYIIQNLIEKLNPILIHSSNPLYIHYLKQISKNYQIKELPLFGNIERKYNKEKHFNSSKTLFNVALFAGIHQGSPIKDFLTWLLAELSTEKLNVKFTFIGNNGLFLQEWTNGLDTKNILYSVLGVRDTDTISKVLSESDLGISTTPYYLSGKSGAIATMLEHKLPVLCVAREWIPIVNTSLSLLRPQKITLWNSNLKLKSIIHNDELSSNNINEISIQFISNLSLAWHP